MRLVFLGSGEFGLPTLEALAAGGHDIRLVVSQPDRPAGRGGKCRQTPIHQAAERLGLPVACPEKPNDPDFARELAETAPDLAVVVAYGHLIKKNLLAIPRLGFVNLHASLLPAYRGAAPVPWAILRGETVSGATVFLLNEEFDSGSILGRTILPIAADDTAGSYLAKLAPLGAELMVDTVRALAEGVAEPKPQDHDLASAAPKLRKEDGIIDWTRPFDEIERRVRAFQPWPVAHTVFETGKGPLRMGVIRLTPAPAANGATVPGQVLSACPKEGLVVMTGDLPARLADVLPEGKRPMRDIEFLRGTRVIRVLPERPSGYDGSC